MADLVAVMAAATFSYASYALLQLGGQLPYSSSTALLASLCFAALFLLMLDHEGAYKRANDLLRIREIEQILRVTVHAFGVGFLVSFFFSQLFSRWILVLAVVFVPLFAIIEKQLAFVLNHPSWVA